MRLSLVLPSFGYTKPADNTVVERNFVDHERGSVQSCTEC